MKPRSDHGFERLEPEWLAPAGVHALTTLRSSFNATSQPGPRGLYGTNFGSRCGDDPAAVAQAKAQLRSHLPAEPVWLEQVHGTDVWTDLESEGGSRVRARRDLPFQPRLSASSASDSDSDSDSAAVIEPVADAAVTSRPGRVLAILTADCLPVFFCNASGDRVGLAHAGWRGLAGGVLERTVECMREGASSDEVMAFLGPAIGPTAFEVGDDVREAFCLDDAGAFAAFKPGAQTGKWWADLYALARLRLARCGIEQVGGGNHCTVDEPQRFYSFRRERQTGRMASLIWIDS